MTGTGTPVPRLLVVADLDYAGGEAQLIELVEAIAPVAVDPRVAVQLRAKALARGRLEPLARVVRERLSGAFLVLNGDAVLASRLDYDGVHWPEASLPERVPAEPRWHSAAVHSRDAVERAERASVQAAIFGSVFAPGSKHGEAAGVGALAAACARTRLPVIAIGGVTPEQVAPCIEAGAAGVAVVSGVIGSPDPAAAMRGYLTAIDHACEHASRNEVSG